MPLPAEGEEPAVGDARSRTDAVRGTDLINPYSKTEAHHAEPLKQDLS